MQLSFVTLAIPLLFAANILASPIAPSSINRDLPPLAQLAARESCPSGQSYGCRLMFRNAPNEPPKLNAMGEQEALKAKKQECGCFDER